MEALFAVIVFAFVLLVLGFVVFAIFEMTPLARHSNSFRDPRTGKRRWQSPHLD